ncbi:hypothetical protein HGO23_19345 [Xenorhabdus budapestensis]|uniref:Uncharacterized protein n=1 Tax=Xenorhabdus budapestensis TaxID=290110 RepID=A0ABX7VGE3_XENBU|nr:hypothetical protein [Xenorhabdus budapestensis]QTL39861.1 hypothetical protein HGO23_19345 [Xenorhabdus budapestensis]
MADRANWDLKAHLSGNAHFDGNSLILNQAANMQSACILTTRLIVGWLPRCIEQELPLFKRFSLSTENIGMQNDEYLCRRKTSMQNSISDNRTLNVTDSYSQMTLCINDIDSQTLHTSLRGAQKSEAETRG